MFELQNQITKFYDSQGKNERIKSFPFPRQYANFSHVFVTLFCIVLPFGLTTIFKGEGNLSTWACIPASLIVSWFFIMMEKIGDYSENPFEGLINDVPITTITRNIEIDVLQMINETNVPKPLEAINGILM
jgi:ion channel-forming bestrophin family protein